VSFFSTEKSSEHCDFSVKYGVFSIFSQFYQKSTI
jgi:hypothetical protein